MEKLVSKAKTVKAILIQPTVINKEMYKVITLILLAWLPTYVQAQNRELTIESDTAFWFHRRITKFCDDLGIPTIDKCQKNHEIRFWDDSKVIRLWDEEDHLRGEVIYFVYQYKKADTF